jgi:hypothetical protein
MKSLSLMILLAAPMVLVGCKSSSTTVAPPLAPGFVNSADQQMDSDLVAAHRFYTSIQQDIVAGKFQPTATEKQVLNTLAVTLNAAQAEYQLFKQGAATQAQAQAQVDQLKAQQASVTGLIPTAPPK